MTVTAPCCTRCEGCRGIVDGERVVTYSAEVVSHNVEPCRPLNQLPGYGDVAARRLLPLLSTGLSLLT